jgi:ribosome biogenesis GTPase
LNEQETISNLKKLGFDDWFASHKAEMPAGASAIARVSAVDRGALLIHNGAAELSAELAGRFRFSAASAADLPCVGDWACVRYHNQGTTAVIHGILPRRTFLRRKTAGRDVDLQMIAANIDTAFIVQSCHHDFNLHRLDRYLVMVADGGIEPVLVLTKTDRVTPEELEKTIAAIRRAGITAGILPLSNATHAGMAAFRESLVRGRTYCLLGSSGVGKTTLINRLLGREAFATRATSASGHGTHATSRRQLIVLDQGALLVDTPGMRELGMLGAGAALDDSFGEIRGLSRACRFPDCRHAEEPGCAVRAAIERGELGADRYESYAKLKKEAAHHEMSFVEKRRKDKAFGKFLKSAKEQMRKK